MTERPVETAGDAVREYRRLRDEYRSALVRWRDEKTTLAFRAMRDTQYALDVFVQAALAVGTPDSEPSDAARDRWALRSKDTGQLVTMDGTSFWTQRQAQRHAKKYRDLEPVRVRIVAESRPQEASEPSRDTDGLRKFCTALLKQYDRIVKSGQDNFGAALCIVQQWEADKLRAALSTPTPATQERT